ncbi:serine/threonine-protein kinase pim-1-like [Chelmon rostratus]|uniref:serine/threonine-protein kinase pim-1-like n=1 Tax=Chelmon rostratus TaxID=109905 RepID=UPI001BEA8179|nr:serine/threonine-protein kinase pim-1-like [Chelmon rostratus]
MPRHLKMEGGQRKVADGSGSPRTKFEGRVNTTRSTGSCNNVQEHVSVRKRRTGDDGEVPPKRRRCSNLTKLAEHSEVSAEDSRIRQGKRKASADAGAPEKRSRCSIDNSDSTDPSELSVEDGRIRPGKRKASADSDAPEKKMRCSSESFSRPTSTTESSAKLENVSCDDDGGDVSQERLYEMSSLENISRADFEDKYRQLGPLGAGGFGSVFTGLRKSDNLLVAIKHIPRGSVRCERVMCNGKEFDIVLEVFFMLKIAGLPGSTRESAAVSLLDWYLRDQELILVMEKPKASMDLHKYVKSCGGSLDEQEAKMILRQLVDAAVDMHSKGVFHRDIKLQNVLVQLDSDVPRVRIIDFGCSSFSTEDTYTSICGTRVYFPPEWFNYQAHWARPTTVYQLGALFYSLLRGHKFFTTWTYHSGRIRINPELSTDVKLLLLRCLASDPMERATLEELQMNSALRELSPPPVLRPPS